MWRERSVLFNKVALSNDRKDCWRTTYIRDDIDDDNDDDDDGAW